jgi:gliding motility-associated-like protein
LVVAYDTSQVVHLGPDTVLCAVFDYTLDAGDDNARWQDGSVGSTFSATRTDWYIAAVTSYCGTAVDSARVSFEVPTDPLEDIALCPGTKVELDPQGELIQTLWSNGDSTRTITVGEGDYSYEAIDIYGCPHSDSVEVRIFSRSDGIVYVPNAFTPNKDGLNDGFFVQGPEAGDFELLIHDRWGREVYSTIDPYKAWDGSSGGQEAPQDVYIYTVSYLDRCNANGTMVSARGHVTLLR